VEENSQAETFVGRITAGGHESYPASQLEYYLNGSEARSFNIHPGTGNLYALLSLDREQQSVYLFTVGVPGAMATARVKVTVDDVNDCPPEWVFPKSPHNDTVHVAFGFGFGEEALAVLVAKDADLGDNARLRSTLRTEISECVMFAVSYTQNNRKKTLGLGVGFR